MKRLLCLVVVLALVGSTFGGTAVRWLGTNSTDWNDGANWDSGSKPNGSGYDAYVRYQSVRPEGCTISSGDQLIGSLFMSRYAGAATDPDAILNCTGGSLTTKGYFISIGYATRPTAVINVYDGFTLNQNASGGTILGAGGDAVINMYGGTFNHNGGGLKIASTGTGELNLHGGVVNVNVWGSGHAYMTIGSGGKINVGDGVLALYGTNSSFLTGLINDGKIALMPGYTDFDITYDSVENYTYLTAVPEPATLLIFAAGGLLVHRKRKS